MALLLGNKIMICFICRLISVGRKLSGFNADDIFVHWNDHKKHTLKILKGNETFGSLCRGGIFERLPMRWQDCKDFCGTPLASYPLIHLLVCQNQV
jgi:hypothetical protein